MIGQAKPDGSAVSPLEPSRALVPHAVRVNASLVRRGFWPKLRRVASSVPFAEDAAALYFAARDPATPVRTKALVLAALAFFVAPKGVVPRRLLALLLLDEAAVIAAAVKLAGDAVQDRHRDAARRLLRRVAG